MGAIIESLGENLAQDVRGYEGGPITRLLPRLEDPFDCAGERGG